MYRSQKAREKQTKKQPTLQKKKPEKKRPSTYAAVMKAMEKEVPHVIQKFRGRDAKDPKAGIGGDLDGDEDFDMESMTDFIETRNKAKRKRVPAAALREKQGDPHLSRDAPKEQRKSDEELLSIGVRSVNEGNKSR